MEEALRQARVSQAARLDAVVDIRDAQTLRLTVLRDELRRLALQTPETAPFGELVLMPGDPPKLWIDLITYVVMQPDPRTYCLVQDSNEGHHVLLETGSRPEMCRKVTELIAHRAVVRQRAIAGQPPMSHQAGRYGSAALWLAWLSGFSLGALALFVVGIVLSRLPG